MKKTSSILQGPKILDLAIHSDERGSFFELWKAGRESLPEFVQDNLSTSKQGVLRGLHLQHPHDQGKLVTVLHGDVVDVAVDVRRGSPDFGKWMAVRLTGGDGKQFYIPVGFAHGFLTLSPQAVVHYKCTDIYSKSSELTIAWDDPDIGIDWPLRDVMLSPKDQVGRRLKEIPSDRLPKF